jgi:hypothetical protein
MADDEQSPAGMVPGLVQEFIAQFRGIAQELEGRVAGLGEHLPPALGALPLPGALSAAQLRTVADSIAAQRRSISALQAQLSAFDEELAVLERILGPLATWSGTWAALEKRLLTMGREPPDEGQAEGP